MKNLQRNDSLATVYGQLGPAVTLCLLTALGACATKPPTATEPQIIQLPPVVKTVNIYPTIPATDLDCKAAPTPAAGITDDVGFAMYNQTVLDAWYDCFTKVKTLKDIVTAWPKE